MRLTVEAAAAFRPQGSLGISEAFRATDISGGLILVSSMMENHVLTIAQSSPARPAPWLNPRTP